MGDDERQFYIPTFPTGIRGFIGAIDRSRLEFVDSGALVLGGETGKRCFCRDRFGKKGDFIRLSSLTFIGFQSTTHRPGCLPRSDPANRADTSLSQRKTSYRGRNHH